MPIRSPLFRVLMPAILFVLFSWHMALASQPLHYDIEVQVDPANRTITVTNVATVSGRSHIRLEVASWLRINRIGLNGKPLKRPVSGNRADVELPNIGQHKISVTAEGTIPKLEAGRPGRGSGSHAVAGSDGIYLPAWSGWLPRIPDGIAGYSLVVISPAPYRAAATGALQSEDLGSNKNVVRFQSHGSFVSPTILIGPYDVSEKRSDSIRIRTYFHGSAARLAESYLSAAEGYLKSYEQLIGPYPFSDFHIVSAPLPVGLGFANMTYVDRRILPFPFMRSRSLAHEVLHNWWGNGVLVDYESGNWSEGLTTYMADHALAVQTGPSAAGQMRLGWLRDYAALPTDKDRPVKAFVSKQHDASQIVGYNKVAFIFHMLKHEVGADQFRAAIRRFWREHRFARAGWRDIEAAFENTTSSKLDWFFRQWIDRTGAPKVTLKSARVSRESAGYSMQVVISQSEPFYRLKVPISVTTEAGKQDLTARLESETKTVRLQFNSKPLSVEIDPDHTLFRRLLPGEAPPIMRDVLLDSSAKTLVLYDDAESVGAARSLAKRLLRAEPKYVVPSTSERDMTSPLLVLGNSKQIGQFIQSKKLPARPTEVSRSESTGRVWTVRVAANSAVLFVEADDAGSLRSIARPLPHYRSKSYITFKASRATNKGVWPRIDGPLTKRFE